VCEKRANEWKEHHAWVKVTCADLFTVDAIVSPRAWGMRTVYVMSIGFMAEGDLGNGKRYEHGHDFLFSFTRHNRGIDSVT
jgi:hypothetical protein